MVPLFFDCLVPIEVVAEGRKREAEVDLVALFVFSFCVFDKQRVSGTLFRLMRPTRLEIKYVCT